MAERSARPAPRPAPGPAAPAAAPAGLVAAPFFALRTSLLPFDDRCPATAGASERHGDRVARARAAWRALAARPEVREALWLASPSLEDSLAIWERDPDSERGQKVERAIVRYLLRMCTRPTPFGLFAGLSVGRRAGATALAIGPRAGYRRHTRLDMDYLVALSRALQADPAVRRSQRYRPTTSLYAAADQLRYVERRTTDVALSYHLAAVEPSEHVDRVLARAEPGALHGELVRAILAADPEVDADEAIAFVDQLIDLGLLVCDLEPPVTGGHAAGALVAALASAPAGAGAAAADALREVAGELEALDAGGLGHPPERYRRLIARLPALPVPVEPSHLLQVDLHKPAPDLTLGDDVVGELARGIALLHRISPRHESPVVRRFRDAFVRRYGEREVPLIEALDVESGVGLGEPARPGDAAPLLAGLAFPEPEPEPIALSARDQVLLALVDRARRDRRTEIELDEPTLAALATADPLPLPRALFVSAALAARGPAQLAAGEFHILLGAAGGPSGAQILGRFCHLTRELEDGVRGHLRREEALQPDAIFAEIVHLPAGRLGNILQRPVLRDHEIVFLGRSGAARDQQLPAGDLRVRVVDGRIELRSARHGRRVIPCLTSAHDHRHGLDLYRLLCALQAQGTAAQLTWTWGAAVRMPGFFPRVRVGRLVLARARWRLGEAELARLAAPTREQRFDAVQALRRDHRLGDTVVVVDGDHKLAIDLDEPLAVDSFVQLTRGRDHLLLEELFPGRDELCATGPEGRFVHELIVPFTIPGPAIAAARSPARPPIAAPAYPPGSEWLEVRVDTGPATADRVLTGVVAPFVEDAVRRGLVDRWAFVRTGDPDRQLRLRFHGAPEVLTGPLWPALYAALAPLVADGRSHRLALDTYVPEIERHGGPRGLLLGDRIAHADSDAALAVLAATAGDPAERWRLALLGLDRLLDDLRLPVERRADLVTALRDRAVRDLRVSPAFEHQLGARYRAERPAIERTLGAAPGDPGGDRDAALAIARRSQRIAGVVDELLELERGGQLTVTLDELAAHLLQAHAHRVLRTQAAAQQLVLHDFLRRWYDALRARRRAPRCRP
jgi:thiopeptide-type bacteriocin biosynthesis protein